MHMHMQYMVTIGTISFRDCIREGGGHPGSFNFLKYPGSDWVKPGKSDGYDGLSTNYFCNGTPLL